MSGFEGKVALVTGSASGIGRVTAMTFAREGAKVVAADVNEQGALETIRLIKEAGGESFSIKCDVSRASEVEAMIKRTVDVYGRLDFAVNNAGVVGNASIVDCTEELWDHVMNVNLKGMWLCMKYEIPQMLKQGGGAIVNTASDVGLVFSQGITPYAASKAAAVALTKVAALDCAPSNIRVNVVCPGPTLTPMWEPARDLDPVLWNLMQKAIPLGRFAKPEEVVEAVVWLCSDKASYVTGVAFPVDGGHTSGVILKQ